MKNQCAKGYHYHPKHPKADASGCMKDDDMEKEGKRENYRGTFSLYNVIRNYSGKNKVNDLNNNYIGV